MSDIHESIIVNADRSRSYAALTTPAGIAGWWSMQSSVAAAEGGVTSMTFVKEGRTVVMKFRVDALESGRRVAWTCTENGNPIWPGTTLTWTLTDVDGGTRIDFTHAGFEATGSPPYEMTVGGWKHFFASLQAYLDTGTGQPW